MPTVLEAIATGTPPLRRTQDYAASFMQRVESLPDHIRARVPELYARTGIDHRSSCIEDYVREAEDFTFYPPTWSLEPSPSTGERNRKYREAAVPLAEQVARAALQQAALDPQAVTHVVTVSCTGFFAPGLDIELVKRLGLRPDTQRVMVGFMGCYAAFNALRVAHSFCQSQPNARVLVVCVELCTLHFQVEDTMESAVINAIFSDGAAAAVLAARTTEEARGRLAYADAHCLLDDDSMDHMTWDIGDTGFRMGLSHRVPGVLARQLPVFLDELLGRNALSMDAIDFWAVHPGGKAIVEKVCEVLALPDQAVDDSLAVLRTYGNMSSPTILFVLARILNRHQAARQRGESGYRRGIAMAFGPGLTLEGALFQQVA